MGSSSAWVVSPGLDGFPFDSCFCRLPFIVPLVPGCLFFSSSYIDVFPQCLDGFPQCLGGSSRSWMGSPSAWVVPSGPGWVPL